MWERVLEVARGDRQEYTQGDRTIHAPNDGAGFRSWPDPNGTAWAVKQYNGFLGQWKRKGTEKTAEKLTKSWLMAVRRSWVKILDTKHNDWDDIMRTFEVLRVFVDNLSDQVLFIRRGPLTSLTGLTEGSKLTKALDALKAGVKDQKGNAQFWRDAYEKKGLPASRHEDGVIMFEKYKTDFLGVTSNSKSGRGGKAKWYNLIDLMDDALKLLREDAARIEKDEAEGQEYEKGQREAYKEFDMYGMKVIVDDSTVTASQIEHYIKYLDEAYQRLRGKGFAKAWYGQVFIQCQECGGVNQNTGGGVGGHYFINKDTVKVYSRPSSFIVELMAHELGHRFWFKQMSQTQRARFESFVKVRPTARRPEGYVPRLISTEALDAVKAEIQKLELKYIGTIEAFVAAGSKAKKWRPVVERFESLFEKMHSTFGSDLLNIVSKLPTSIDAGKEVSSLYKDIHAAIEKVRKFIFDKGDSYWWNSQIMNAPPPPAGSNVDRYYMTVFDNLLTRWSLDLDSPFTEAITAATIYVDASFEAHNRLEKAKGDDNLKKWDEQYENDTRPVKPVSDYGGSNIDEAFAEVFAYYVLDKELDRDQIESFKAVLKTASFRRAAFANPEWKALERLRLGAVLSTRVGDETDVALGFLARQGLVKLAAVDSAGNRLWDITRKGHVVVTAGLADEFERRVNNALSKDPPDNRDLLELSKWVTENFRVHSAKTPKGTKPAKEALARFINTLKDMGTPGAVLVPGVAGPMLRNMWGNIERDLPLLIQNFTEEGDVGGGRKPVVTEIRLSHAKYINRANASFESFEKYAKAIDNTLGSLKGWRRKAMTGSLTVVFVGLNAMSVKGKYRVADDEMWVRVTPSILKHDRFIDYIIIHEMGHRYEHKIGLPANADFERHEWYTTTYSKSGTGSGEAFAELFALGHFKIPQYAETLERFEAIMSGGGVDEA